MPVVEGMLGREGLLGSLREEKGQPHIACPGKDWGTEAGVWGEEVGGEAMLIWSWNLDFSHLEAAIGVYAGQ